MQAAAAHSRVCIWTRLSHGDFFFLPMAALLCRPAEQCLKNLRCEITPGVCLFLEEIVYFSKQG